jgi:biopolymer transport protein TolQ
MLHFFLQATAPLAVGTTDIAGGFRGDIWELVAQAGPVVKGVLLLLILMSVGCWGIVLLKLRVLRAAIKESETFLTLFWEESNLARMYREAETLPNSPLAEIFRSGFIELQKFSKLKSGSRDAGSDRPGDILHTRPTGIDNIHRALDQATTSELSRLEKSLSFLATTGSTAPFIGLFGTVWGIMDSFRQIGIRGSANLATVAPGIAEALVATALGLFAAIPAVVAYNYFTGKIRMISSEMDNFSAEFLNIIERHFEALKHHGNDDKR